MAEEPPRPTRYGGASPSAQPLQSPSATQAKARLEMQRTDASARYPDILGKRYRILQRVGKGSYGTVFKACDVKEERLVALKRVESDDIDAIVEEISIMEQMRDPHIVAYLGNFLADDYLWIAMEYAPYGSISDVMRITRMSLGEIGIATVCRDVLMGLMYLHAQRKVHRDIKPHNILLGETGVAKIADFGVSGQLNSFVEKRTTITGTPYYIAPEILSKNGSGYDIKADIWSLGISAIEMAQQAPPHYSLSPMKALLVIPNDPPPTLNDPEKFSKEFNSFLAAVLIKDPLKRPTSDKLLTHPFIAMKAVTDPWMIHGPLLQRATSVIEAEGGLENALRNAKLEEKMKEAKAALSPEERDKADWENVANKQKEKARVTTKLKRFFMRRPKEEDILHVLNADYLQSPQPQQRRPQVVDLRWHRAGPPPATSSSGIASLPPPAAASAACVSAASSNSDAKCLPKQTRPRTMFLGGVRNGAGGNSWSTQSQLHFPIQPRSVQQSPQPPAPLLTPSFSTTAPTPPSSNSSHRFQSPGASAGGSGSGGGGGGGACQYRVQQTSPETANLDPPATISQPQTQSPPHQSNRAAAPAPVAIPERDPESASSSLASSPIDGAGRDGLPQWHPNRHHYGQQPPTPSKGGPASPHSPKALGGMVSALQPPPVSLASHGNDCTVARPLPHWHPEKHVARPQPPCFQDQSLDSKPSSPSSATLAVAVAPADPLPDLAATIPQQQPSPSQSPVSTSPNSDRRLRRRSNTSPPIPRVAEQQVVPDSGPESPSTTPATPLETACAVWSSSSSSASASASASTVAIGPQSEEAGCTAVPSAVIIGGRQRSQNVRMASLKEFPVGPRAARGGAGSAGRQLPRTPSVPGGSDDITKHLVQF